MTTTILALDLGKFNSVLCWFEPATRDTTFRTVKTTPAELRRELGRQPVARVVIEACSPAGWVHDLCGHLGLACDAANTSGAAWQWKNVKRKTDRDDALKLARLSAVGERPTVTVAAKPVREWKSLIGLRKRLVGERGQPGPVERTADLVVLLGTDHDARIAARRGKSPAAARVRRIRLGIPSVIDRRFRYPPP